MKNLQHIFLTLVCLLTLGSCQDKDYDIAAPVISPIDANSITGQLEDNDYVWSWNMPQDMMMEINLYDGTTFLGSETVKTNSYIHRNIDTNIEYTYVFKLSDGTNVSTGVIKRYTRPGAAKMTGISLAQVEKTVDMTFIYHGIKMRPLHRWK